MKRIACIVLSILFIFLFSAPALAAKELTLEEEGNILYSNASDPRVSVPLYTTAKVNARAGAGTKFEALAKLRRNAPIRVLAVEGDWLKIIWGESEAYVFKMYTTFSDLYEQPDNGTFEEDLAYWTKAKENANKPASPGDDRYDRYIAGKTPLYYAGCFADHGEFHVMTTDMSEKAQKTLRTGIAEYYQFSDSSDIVIEKVKYSLKDLAEKEKKILSSLSLRRYKDYIQTNVNPMDNTLVLLVNVTASDSAIAAIEKVIKKHDHVRMEMFDFSPPKV